jgi:WXG100 family type VII secretion target
MSMIKVTPEQLEEWSGQLARTAANIQSELSAARNLLQPAAEDWIGHGAQAFQEKWDEWERSASGINDALESISQMLGRAATTYSQSDTDAAGLMG